MKKQRKHKKTTRPKTRRRPELFTGPVRSSNDKRQHKTTQDTQTTTRTGKHLDSEKKKWAMKTRDFFFFFRTWRGKRVLVGAIERVGCGTSLEQKGATRGSMRSRSASDKKSEDERRTNEPININKRFHEVESGKRPEERRRAKNE